METDIALVWTRDMVRYRPVFCWYHLCHIPRAALKSRSYIQKAEGTGSQWINGLIWHYLERKTCGWKRASNNEASREANWTKLWKVLDISEWILLFRGKEDEVSSSLLAVLKQPQKNRYIYLYGVYIYILTQVSNQIIYKPIKAPQMPFKANHPKHV